MENNQEIKIENKVMQEITTGKIKLRSRYIFWAKKFGWRSALIFTALLAALFFNLILFYLRTTDNLWYLSFGSRGLFAFFESFPYPMVIIAILFTIAAILIIRQISELYKKPIWILTVTIFGIVFFSGIVLAFTNVAQTIERDSLSREHGAQIFRPFLDHGINPRRSGIAGKIESFTSTSLRIQTPHGEKIIDISKIKNREIPTFTQGNFVIAIGRPENDTFVARDIRFLNSDDMPMIRHGIENRFGQPPPPPPIPNNLNYNK